MLYIRMQVVSNDIIELITLCIIVIIAELRLFVNLFINMFTYIIIIFIIRTSLIKVHVEQ